MSRIYIARRKLAQAKSVADRHRPAGAGGCRTAGLRGRDRHHPPVPQVRGHHARRLPCAAQMKRKSAFSHRSRRFVRQNPKSKQPAFFRNITSGGKRAVFSQGPGRKNGPRPLLQAKSAFFRPIQMPSAQGKANGSGSNPAGNGLRAGHQRAVRPEQQTRGVQRRQHKVRRRILRLRGAHPL